MIHQLENDVGVIN